MAKNLLDAMISKDLSYCRLMELMMEGADASAAYSRTKENALHLLYRYAVRPMELYNTTKLLVENGCDV